MGLNDKQKKKMEAFIKNTGNRVVEYGGGRASHLTDDLLGTIETILSTGILQKYVYTQLGISENTWEGWKRKGKATLAKIQDEEDQTTWDDLKENEKRWMYLVAVIESSKAKVVTNGWQNMRDLSKTNFKACEFILRTLGKNDFLHADHYVHHGVGAGGEEDETIENELSGFMSKTIEELNGEESE